MTILQEGDMAPDFSLSLDDGTLFRLASHRGSPVVLFFYPQDDTEGCTIENQEFSLLASEFERRGAVVVGISPDSVATHCKFRGKYDLVVRLAADPDHIAIGGFGLWRLKTLYGREFEGLVRTSVLIDGDGRIARLIRATRIKGHAQKMLDAVDALLSPPPPRKAAKR